METIAKNITLAVSHGVEILAAIIIGTAVLLVLRNYVRPLVKSDRPISKEAIRVQFGSSVAVALELMLGADVLATAVAPSWNDIGKLAAIAVVLVLIDDPADGVGVGRVLPCKQAANGPFGHPEAPAATSLRRLQDKSNRRVGRLHREQVWDASRPG